MDNYRNIDKAKIDELKQDIKTCKQKLKKKTRALERLKEVIAQFLDEKG